MTTPSGQISLSDVNTELGYSATALITMNDAAVRTLAGVGGSGTVITMQNLQGKSNQYNFTISSNQSNYDLRSAAVAAGWNQTSKLAATINSGVYVYSTSTGSAGLTISGAFPGGVSLVNNGYILGQGGNGGPGGAGGYGHPGTAGSAGGLALSVSSPVSITNNGVIGGGGGGGGGGGSNSGCCNPGWAGGGGGGGQTGLNNSSGGSAGSPNEPQSSTYPQPGGAGTSGGAGGGGQRGASPNGAAYAGPGGPGGGSGSAGSSGGSGGGVYGGTGSCSTS